MVFHKISESMQNTSDKNLYALLEKLIKQTENGEEINTDGIVKASGSVPSKNNSKIIYLKTVTEPQVIYKKESNNNVQPNENLKTTQFQYDDKEINESDLENDNEHLNKNEEEHRRAEPMQSKTSINGDILSASPAPVENSRNEGQMYPDIVIDQLVYEESETKVDNLKKSIEDLERKIDKQDKADKRNFIAILSELGKLNKEIQKLKRTHDQLNENDNEPVSRNVVTNSELTDEMVKLRPVYGNFINPSAIAISLPQYKQGVVNYISPNLVTRLKPVVVQPTVHVLQPVVPRQKVILPQLQVSMGLNNIKQRLVNILPTLYKRVH
ncbi:uncharacterized protein LOC123695040 isoform X2 [Colias croceus]|nr:uncharacterized protein LOC123695040 isoform X2 [Colias croceus]